MQAVAEGAGACGSRACELPLLASLSVPWRAAGASPPDGCGSKRGLQTVRASKPEAQARARAKRASIRYSRHRACPDALQAHRRLKVARARRNQRSSYVREQLTRAATARVVERALGMLYVAAGSTSPCKSRACELPRLVLSSVPSAHSRRLAASKLLMQVADEGADTCESRSTRAVTARGSCT